MWVKMSPAGTTYRRSLVPRVTLHGTKHSHLQTPSIHLQHSNRSLVLEHERHRCDACIVHSSPDRSPTRLVPHRAALQRTKGDSYESHAMPVIADRSSPCNLARSESACCLEARAGPPGEKMNASSFVCMATNVISMDQVDSMRETT